MFAKFLKYSLPPSWPYCKAANQIAIHLLYALNHLFDKVLLCKITAARNISSPLNCFIQR